MTLYAQWSSVPVFTVTFEANYPYVAGGSGTMNPENFTSGVAKALTANGFSDTGYTFAGWGTAPAGPVVYSDGQSITITSSITLYAQWTANSLTVTFNSNYPYVAGGSGSMSSESFTAGTAKALTANGFSDTGYTFAGWGTAPGGPVVYSNSQSITIYSSVTLYAQWTANSLTVTFNSNYPYVAGGSGSMSSESFTAGTAKALTANGFSDTGYTFAGWGTAPGGPVVYTDGESITIYTSTTLYAQWTANSLTVTFNSNYPYVAGGSGSMSSESFTAGTAKALTANGFSDTGYTFAGWGTAPGGPVVYTNSQSITIYTSTTLYAQWTANSLTVNFNSNYPYSAGGSGSMSSESFTAGTAKALTANAFSDTGYTFAGWGTVPEGPVVYTNSQSITIYFSVTLYAQWTANSLTVTFDANGGTGSMSSESFTAGTAKTLTANAFSNSGYTFAGWGTAPGGPVVYSDGQSITIYSSTALYAQWTQNAITHNISLVSGWNLVSFKVHPSNTSPAAVLSSLGSSYSLVYAWDATGAQWRKYVPGAGYGNTLEVIDETMGFWVKVSSAGTLSVSGTAPVSSTISLKNGWNLVGFPASANLALPGAFGDHGVGTDFSLVYAYHASDTSDPWKLFDRLGPDYANDLLELASGWGFWARLSADHNWIVTY